MIYKLFPFSAYSSFNWKKTLVRNYLWKKTKILVNFLNTIYRCSIKKTIDLVVLSWEIFFQSSIFLVQLILTENLSETNFIDQQLFEFFSSISTLLSGFEVTNRNTRGVNGLTLCFCFGLTTPSTIDLSNLWITYSNRWINFGNKRIPLKSD